jgi:replicative DNA helicase Mcm
MQLIIKRIYVKLRNAPVAVESATRTIPISARQLGALVRMAEASARVRLSEEVTENDTKSAIELLKFCLEQVAMTKKTKTYDINKIATGMASSERNKIILVRETIKKLSQKLGELVPIEEVEKELEGNVTKEQIEEAIAKLKNSGDVFSPRRGYIQTV